MVLEDSLAVISYINSLYPHTKMHWIGHSGGGLAILMTLVRNSNFRSNIASITTLASQATDAGLTPSNRLKIHIGNLLTRILQVAPGKIIGLGPENEYARVMQQWFRWNLSGDWLGTDGFNYMKGLSSLDTPVLTFSGEGDTFIAPASGCVKLHKALASSNKVYHHCAIKNGYKEDYNHSRIIASRSAMRDIWPKIEQWLLSNG